jgi:hypothetical protein
VLYPVFSVWEAVFSRFVGTRPIPGGSGVAHYIPGEYEGPKVQLDSGHEIQPGDPVLEIHFVNTKMREYAGEASPLWAISKAFRAEFRALARAAAEKQVPDFVVLYAVTLMGPGARRLGFELHPTEDTLGNRWIAWWEKVLKAIFHPTGSFRSEGPTLPETAWMPREVLLKKHGPRD